MSSDWFWCVLVIPFYVAKVFSESVTWSFRKAWLPCFCRSSGSSGSPPRATYWSTIITTNVTKRTFRPHSIHSHVSPSQPLHTDWQIIVYIALIGVIQHSPLNWLIIAVTYTTQAAVKLKPEKKFRPERDSMTNHKFISFSAVQIYDFQIFIWML